MHHIYKKKTPPIMQQEMGDIKLVIFLYCSRQLL